MRYSVLSGGKRFRPLLLLAAGEYFGASRDRLLPFACAIELIHNYSLIHDDLPSMDDDDFRRGKPSCHKAFGEDIALLAGDSLLTLSFEIMIRAPWPAEQHSCKEKAMQVISRAAGPNGMIEGQFLDISLAPDSLTEDILHRLIRKKTCALIEAAVKAGGILGLAESVQIQALEEYGAGIGSAFQIRDDLLDSQTERKKGAPFRPNYVSFSGVREAERRLHGLVDSSLASLDGAGIRSEELRSLALELKETKKS
jgi:geranylgeranyl diphosphate synthase type II